MNIFPNPTWCGTGAGLVRDWCGSAKFRLLRAEKGLFLVLFCPAGAGTGAELVRDWCGTGAGLVLGQRELKMNRTAEIICSVSIWWLSMLLARFACNCRNKHIWQGFCVFELFCIYVS